MKRLHAYLSLLLVLALTLSAGASLAAGMQSYEIPALPFSAVTVPPATIIQQLGEMKTEGQKDVYTYTIPRDGRYRFEMSELYGGAQVDMTVLNRLDEKVAVFSYCGNGSGITLKGAKAGETYKIRLAQNSRLSAYILNIGEAKPILDLAELTQVTDSIEYTDQRNVYTFTIPADGRYRFELSEMRAGFQVSLHIFNHLGEDIGTYSYAGNGSGITLKNMKAGEACRVAVCQQSGLGDYTLSIGKQKAPLIFSGDAWIQDRVEYTDQDNIYGFTAEKDGSLTVSLSEIPAGRLVNIDVRNHLNESLRRYNYAGNGATISLDGIRAGKYYEVHVFQNDGFAPYELTITQ